MKLSLETPRFYRVKRGQTLNEVATVFRLPPRLLARENGLEEVGEGTVLKLPAVSGNLYTVKGGESKTLLCGSKENYEKKNGACLYIGQTVLL